ncbi:MAG TPA: penicillin-binding protein 2 [Syntrophales bacterium]|nr:penicillin-binding protein 2 [Syntrophales bacterium]
MEELQARLNDQQSSEFQLRFKSLFAVILVALSLVIIRLGYLQIIRGDEFLQKSENNSIRLRKIRPPRGLIMDLRRQVMVENQPSFDILFAPNRVGDIAGVMRKMKDIYDERNLDFSIDSTLAERARPFAPVSLERNASWEKVALAETNALDLPGVFVEVTPIRWYHDGEIISHIVGYTGEVTEQELKKDASEDYSAGDIVGKYGVERYLDVYLRGKNGAEQIEVNVSGKKVKVLGMIPPSAGYNVQLTIDSFLQKTAWKAMDGKTGSAVVMDPRDGNVLALVSSPSFDANLFNGGISFAGWEKLSTNPRHPLENRAIAGQYPPGSTYKLVVAAAALEEGLITPEKTFFCNGTYELGNRVYRCWQKKGHGAVNLHRAIVESCDVYFYNLGKLTGVDKIAWYARQFGFGSATGIDLFREKSGLIPTKQWKFARFGETWQMGETTSTAIGQGFNLVTPIQLLNAYSALANGGALFRPRIIKQIETADGVVFRQFRPEKKNTLPVSKKNLEALNYGLWGAVNERGGTGYVLKRKEEDVCGKTGTAQVIGLPEDEKARRAKKIAYEYRDHALFVCFAPYKNPEIAVAVVLENAGHGGTAAAPAARKIIDAYFLRKNQEAEGGNREK